MKRAGVAASNNGCIVKTVRSLDRGSQPGGAPHHGINAVCAASIGVIMAVDLLWGNAETAREILKAWTPRMTKEERLTVQGGVARTELHDSARELNSPGRGRGR